VGPGADSSRGRECWRKCFGRERKGMARTGATGHGRIVPGADFRRVRMGLGADSRCGRMESGTNSSRARGCESEYRVRAWAKGESGTTIAVETRVWVQTGATSGAGLNGRVLERGRAGARGYGCGGINKSSSILVICQSLFQINSLSQHAQRTLQGTMVWKFGPSANFGGGAFVLDCLLRVCLG
jgi:hypothetical protein